MNEEQETELKQQIDAILFAAGNKVESTEIARLCNMGHNLEAVEKALLSLKQKYDAHPSLMLLQEGNAYKLQVREKYISVVKNIVTKTELTKTVMETLAVVAYKAPVLQSDIIRIRTNKAYDHLAELENAGYITRAVKGRSKLIKLTPKFFDYFDVPPEKLKEKFKSVAELEKAVEEKEKESGILHQEHTVLHAQKK
ncbi:MAG: SMC-Scp complex subunit ScpB, partial [Candidatus Woesearchaeota archaeon]|nr:SMC-Scp complex subunit ScpB [Candidatus Woesearchaeota archaeon]